MFDLIRHQKRKEPDLLKILWIKSWQPIFDAVGDTKMTLLNDDKILKKLRDKYMKISQKTGKPNYRQANSAYRTFKDLRLHGWEGTKKEMSRPTFYRHIKMLTSIDLSKAYLQNLYAQQHTENVYPLINFVKADFGKQHPDTWKEETISITDILNEHGFRIAV